MFALTKPITAAALILTTGFNPATAQEGMTWQYYSTIGTSVFDTHLSAVYGVPQSDGIQFQASCAIGAGGPYIVSEFSIDIGARPENSAETLTYIDNRGQSGSLPVSVVGRNREVGGTGAEYASDMTDPFWQMMMAGGLFSYGFAGQEMASISLAGANEALGALMSDCANIDSLAPIGGIPAFPASVSCQTIFDTPSQNGDVPQTVTFTNGSEGYRALFWMDYDGAPVFMEHLDPGQAVTYDTYLTHPWMVTDGPGNCLETMVPQAGNSSYMFTAANQYFGPE